MVVDKMRSSDSYPSYQLDSQDIASFNWRIIKKLNQSNFNPKWQQIYIF